MRFNLPIDGDMLNNNEGNLCNGCLFIKVQVIAYPGELIYVNGVPCVYDGQFHVAEVPLYGYRNMLTAYNTGTGVRVEIGVYWLRNATYKSRLSLDDNIYCLRDLAYNANNYKSVFENPYFALFKRMHDIFGTKVHMNIYYQCEDFNISMLTEQYKAEFRNNAHWLQFSFHSLQDQPDKPYQCTDFTTILRDYDLVTEQIIRFAGEECVSPVTTVHWGECTRAGVRALRARGIRALMGYFQFEADGITPYVSYYYDHGQALHHSTRDFWKDHKEDMIFGRIYHVLNEGTLEDINKIKLYGGFLELMMHEQYFIRGHHLFLSDFEQRVIAGEKLAAEHGYKPSWVQDCILESC